MPRSPKPLPAPFDAEPFTVHAADEAGIGRNRLKRQDLDSPFRSVRSPGPLKTVLERARAFRLLMVPGEFFSHGTAAVLHGMRLPFSIQQDTVLHVSVRRPMRAPRDAGVVGHHLIDRPGLVQTRSGLPIADPVETWCQLATVLGVRDLVIAGDGLIAKGVPDAEQIRDRLVAAAHDPGRPYHRRLVRAALLTRCGTRSAKETELRLLLQRAGLPEPEINADIRDESGRFVAESDIVYRRARVLVEYEGDGHRERAQFRKDIVRYERLQDLDWRIIRVTDDDLALRPDELVGRVRRALDEGMP